MHSNSEYKVNSIDSPANIQDIDWSQAELLNEFISPWRDAPANTTFRALHDKDHFYFRFEVIEAHIMVYRDTDHEEEVVRSERVEIFFRQDDTLNPYYCLEMDASGRVFDYQAAHYREFQPDWTWPEDQLEVMAEQTTDGYAVSGKVSLESLEKLGLLSNDKIQAGLFRGRRTGQKSDSDAEFHWVSWIDPKTEEPDFHVKSSFGELILMR